MTPEEAMQLYNKEQRKYYEYCNYICTLQNRIGEYQSERQNKLVLADNQRIELQKNQEIFQSIGNTTTSRDGLFSHLSQINTKVAEAALNFNNMVYSSTVNAIDLGETYGENVTKANSKLTEVFDLINSAKSTIQGIIDGIQSDLNATNSRIQELESLISRAQAEINEYESEKQRCLANMAYYKKMMVQVT